MSAFSIMSNSTIEPIYQASYDQIRPPLISGIPDYLTVMLVPITAYWILSLSYLAIDELDLFPQYRLHTPEEISSRNLVGRWECAFNVMQQQVGQILMGITYGLICGPEYIGDEAKDIAWWVEQIHHFQKSATPLLALAGIDAAGLKQYPLGWSMSSSEGSPSWEVLLAMAMYNVVIPALRLFVALCVIDTWQYFFHRMMHMNRWCYKKWHSQHHKLYVPYSYGALYGSRAEGFLSETTGAGLAFLISGMSPRQGMLLFTFGSIKAVTDHSGYVLPWDPLQYFSANNAAYHDLHHQKWGQKANFSQPFFTFWDEVCGTKWKGVAGKPRKE